MSSDIVKEAVFDGRIIQSRPKYAVEKGALSITNAPFSAISQSSSQHTYNIYVPSENVFVDRALEWTSTCFLQARVAKSQYTYDTATGTKTNTNTAPIAPGTPLLVPGQDVGLCAFPLNALCSTQTTTINDTTSVINSQDVQREVLRLTDYKHNRIQRTAPTMLDVYLQNTDAGNATRDSLAGYDTATGVEYVPNGSYAGFTFTMPNGADGGAGALGDYTAVGSDGNNYVVNVSLGYPIYSQTNANPLPCNVSVPVYMRFTSTEKLVLSPFVFADTHECDTGLFGINNIQLIMNFRSPSLARVVRLNPQLATAIVNATTTSYTELSLLNLDFNAAKAPPFEGSIINTQFLTPSLETALPPKSVVPYMEFPRYITTGQTAVAPGATTEIASQTITLPQIPDLLIIYCKAVKATGAGNPLDKDPQDLVYGDGYLPIAVSKKNPLRVQFDNFSGLLSSHTPQQLYAMSVRNGLEMDWNQWSGKAWSGAASGKVSLTGGFLVLKPSQDITLQSGQAPSLVGNFTLQFNVEVQNNYPFAVQPQLYVITANSGFFESIRGSSRIIKGVLSEQDIISAPLASTATHSELKRIVGGKGLLSNLGNILSKARDVYHATKPAVSMLKEHLPEGKVRDAMSAVGYGTGGMSGGRSGGRSGGKKSIADRLM